jgi:hypothetical protein
MPVQSPSHVHPPLPSCPRSRPQVGCVRWKARSQARFATLLLLGVGGTACRPEAATWAEAYKIENLSQAIGGPKALARPGDFILQNDQIRLAILSARPSMGPHTSGGSLIDADLQRNDPRYSQGRGLDQLAEVFPTVNLNVQTADDLAGEVTILSDGSDGGDAVICTIGPEQSFITLLDALWTFQWPKERPLFHMRTDWILSPGLGAVKVKTTALFSEDPSCADPLESETLPGRPEEEGLPLIDLALSTTAGGLVFGDFYLQGGSTDVFTPGVGFDEETYVNSLLEEDVNTFATPIVVDYLAGTADRVSYALVNESGPLYVPMFTSSQTVSVGAGVAGDGTNMRFDEEDGPYSYVRWFGVGRGDVGSAIGAAWEAMGRPLGRVSGHVYEEATGIALSEVRVLVFEEGADAPMLEWRTDVGDDQQLDGSFSGVLPPGRYQLLVHAEGRPDSEKVGFTVQAGQELTAVLTSPRPASVRFRVVDETGLPTPAKVSFFAAGGTESPRNPIYGDSFIGDNPAAVIFSNSGSGSVVLPPGEYYAIASRGIEYELDRSPKFKLETSNAAELELQVVRSVDTTGWISADFHVHAQRSHDSGVSLPDRVTTMVAEGVEFMASTDHDSITDYAPAIAQMGLQPWITSTVGLEVTTIEVGHFLGFPLRVEHLDDQGGALDWYGLAPQQMIDGLRELGVQGGEEPVVFVGHPRDGILGYFDQYAVNTYRDDEGGVALDVSLLNQVSGNQLLVPENFSTDFDALEVLNAKRLEMIRTPTEAELEAYAEDEDSVSITEIMARTAEEQEDLEEGVYKLGAGRQGVLDDWFMLNNLGLRYTALGNSDTHGFTSTEAGCPRNFVVADTDEPGFLDEGAIARAVKEGRVVASFGPFIRFYTGTETYGPGSDVRALNGSLDLTIEVQSPSWIGISRVELYENGRMIREWTGSELDPDAILKLATEHRVEPSQDSWYVIVAMGETDLSPVFTPVEFPPIQLEDIVSGALAGIAIGSFLDAPVPHPRDFPLYPYAVTNPIWVDADGDGVWTPPGIPAWYSAAAPEE